MLQALELGGPDLPWRFMSLPPSMVDVTVTPRGDAEVGVEVTSQNAEAEALLGYMRTGAVAGAEAIAERLLQRELYLIAAVAQITCCTLDSSTASPGGGPTCLTGSRGSWTGR